MTRQEFQTQMARLMEVFNEKNYPDERLHQIWEWAKKIDNALYSLTVSKLIAEQERAPLLPKFKETFLELKLKLPMAKLECAYCDGSGLILDPDSGFPGTAYACNCPAGHQVPSYVVRWNKVFVRVVPTKEQILEARKPKDIILNSFKNIEPVIDEAEILF